MRQGERRGMMGKSKNYGKNDAGIKRISYRAEFELLGSPDMIFGSS